MKQRDRYRWSRELDVGLKGRNPEADRTWMRRLVAWTTALALLVGVLVIGPTRPAFAATVDGAGTVHGGLHSNQFESGSDLDALANATGKRVTFGGTFMSVVSETRPADPGQWSNVREQINEIWKGKSTPFVNLEIPGSAVNDAALSNWINHLQLYLNLGGGRNLILAPLQEMNGNWTPWGCNPSGFINNYRKIVDAIRARGINETKVRFAFAPNGWTTPGCGSISSYYPGDGYVDLISISAYRWSDGGSVQSVMGSTIDQLAAWYPSKPLMISQTAAWPSSSKDQWIRDMFAWAAGHPHVVGIVYFNFNSPGETDWRVWMPPFVNPGWRDGMLSPSTAYQWPLTGWFQPGPLNLSFPPGVNLCPSGKDCDTTAFQEGGGRFQIFTYSTSGSAQTAFFYGVPGDIPFSGDWDCNGTETLGLYRRSDGFVYLRNSNSQGAADISYYFGIAGDFPVAGDFNGDHCDTVSIYRPSEGRFYITNRLGSNNGGFVADYSFFFGVWGDKPFVGDYNGDGIDTIGLHRESSGLVYFRDSNTSGFADFQFFYGVPGDKLVAGDWDGDGRDTIGVYRPSNRMFYVRNSNTTGVADSQVYVGPQVGVVPINP